MRRLVGPTLCVLLLACGPAPEPRPEPRPEPDRDLVVPGDELAGLKVEETSDGPWTIRRTRSGSRSRGDLAEGASLGKAKRLEAKDEAVGAEPAPAGEMLEAEHSGVPAPSKAAGYTAGAGAPTPQPGLRAGSTDDNEAFDAFLEFLVGWSDKPGLAGRFQMLDVRDRRYVRVVNREGKPVPAAEVRVVDEAADRILLDGTTYGDGRVPFYPRVAAAEGAVGPAAVVRAEGAPGLLVEASFGDVHKRVRWDGKGEELAVELDVPRPVEDPVKLDVCILLDTTGSMGDEIDRIKATLLRVTERLRSLEREFDLRYGAVLYRDIGDEYVTKTHPMTGDIRAFDHALQAVRASGGGDGPESLNQGLAEAVGRLAWRDGAAKVMFLIADAPPHMDYEGDVPYGTSLKAAAAKGIRIHSVAASGLGELGSLIFRQIAQYARGKFVFIEYGTIEESAAAHGVKGKVKANNLDDILFEQIREEVALWGRGS